LGLHDEWYKNAVLYCLDVETFADGNGDGIGDFTGLTRRLDYLSSLGVSALWLMPFYPTPGGDDGYDVADYTTVDPRLGTMADFAEFMVETRERGMHVIIDLVPNHTSIEHPWFQAARRDPSSPYRDYYVWRTDDPGDTSAEVVFPGEQDGIWTFDDLAGAWYLHHFYPFQPDLNWENPALRDEFRRILGLWLELGVDGFRVDAAPFLSGAQGMDQRAHDFLEELRNVATLRTGNAILLGEVDVGLSTLADYFGGGNELQALFNFHLNRYLFLGLAQESADPIRFGLLELPSIPGSGQWVNFLRHHDEANLSRLTKAQREAVFARFAPKPSMQVYGRGIRRRLAPMLGGDTAWLKLAYSVLFSLPGAPMLFYGEEIGMAEQMQLPARMAVRAPMQWTSYGSGGFSSAPKSAQVRPMVNKGPYSFTDVSVGAMRGDADSLLNWLTRLIRTRRECGEIGVAKWNVVDTENDSILCLRYDMDDCSILILNNLSRSRQSARLSFSATEAETATDLLVEGQRDPLRAGDCTLELGPFGYRWLRLGGIY
jgi:maltose alpha-D-glucosyltransferase/alpha-amylase